MLDREQFIGLRAAVAAFDNRAVFEVPKILEALISRHAAGRNPTAPQFATQIHHSM